MTLQAAIPIFRIFQVELAKAFYVEWLGFTVDWQHEFAPGMPKYLQISRSGLTIHLTEHHGDCCPGGKAFVHIDDVDALHQELQSRRNPYMNPGVEDAPWGARVLEVIDPFGNRICFAEMNKEEGAGK